MAEGSELRCMQLPGLQQPRCFFPRIRKVGSKGAVLVTVWTSIVTASLVSLVDSSAKFNYLHSKMAMTIAFLFGIVAFLCAPFAGLIATVYFGRWKVIRTSIWIMWIGSVVIAFVEVLLVLVPTTPETLTYWVTVIAMLAFVPGTVTFVVNSIPFGLDQMPDASSEQITAFIHWYIWSTAAGMVTLSAIQHTIKNCTHGLVNLHLLNLSISAVLLTLALCTKFQLRRWLIIEPESKNPLRVICNVLKFAAKHKVPVRRSAFTFWEPEIPSRINLGKSKYGGPFTNEEVEDTKTCLQMLLIIVAVSVTVSSFMACFYSLRATLRVMLTYQGNCWNSSTVLLSSLVYYFLFSLPVYDTITHLVGRWCFSSTLKRISFAEGVLALCPSITLLIMSTVWYKVTSPDQCVFANTDGLSTLPLDYRVIEVPLWTIYRSASFFFFTAMLEYLCAQAPYNLRGLLVGLFQSTMVLSVLFGGIIFGAWTLGYKHHTHYSMCGIWFYLFTTIIAILGCVIWCVVAKWYKRRERDEPEMIRIFAENYYDKYT